MGSHIFIKGGSQIEPTVHNVGLKSGLNSTKRPPQIKDLLPFEEDSTKLEKTSNFEK